MSAFYVSASGWNLYWLPPPDGTPRGPAGNGLGCHLCNSRGVNAVASVHAPWFGPFGIAFCKPCVAELAREVLRGSE